MPLGIFVPAALNDLSVDVAVGTPARGATLYRGATKWNSLAAGTSGQVLTSGGAGADPAWATPTTGVTTLAALTDVTLTGTARGQLFFRGATTWNNLAVGTSGQYLVTQGAGADPLWQTLPTTLAGNVTILPATTARNVVQPSANVVPLTLKAFGGASDLQVFRDSSDNLIGSTDQSGQVWSGANASGGGIFVGSNKLQINQNPAAPFQLQIQSHFTTPAGILAGFGGAAAAGQPLTAYASATTDNTMDARGFGAHTGNFIQTTTESPLVTWAITGCGTGTAAVSTMQWRSRSSASTALLLASVVPAYVVSTAASYTSRLIHNIVDFNATREVLRFESSGTAAMIGFLGAAAVVRPTAYTQTDSTATRTHSVPTATSVATTAATNTTPFGYTTQAQADAIVTAINALIVDVRNVKSVVNSVIDDQQANGLFG